MKRILSISYLILPLLALASAHCLSAQTLVVDKATLTFSGQVGGSAVTQTINVTSSTGAPINFTLSAPSFPWIKFNGQPLGFAGTTPVAVTVTADPTGFSAGTIPASIVVNGGSANNNPIVVTFTVSAISASPASLAFTYTVGSNAFPASQVIALSSGAATQCTATAATISGGSWFTLLQNSCVSPGSLTVLINNAVLAGLAPNTYNGTVTITLVAMTIPVTPVSPPVVVPMTLTVAPRPPVTVDPQSLIFNWQTGSPNPSQTFTVSASQPLTVGVVGQGQVDTGNWSFSVINTGTGAISATTGTLSITVTVNPTGIGPGTYTGHLTLLTPGGSPSQTTIAVTLNVSNTALLNVPNAKLNFTGQVGSTPAPQTVNITSTGTLLNYSVSTSANSPWLSVPNAGSTATPLTVSVNPAGLTQGTYSATINVVSATQGSTAQQIPVVLKVTNDPTISASVSTLSFPYQIGQSAAVAQRSVKITSITGVPLNYTASLATTTCGSAWLQAASANNSLSGVTDDTLRVSVAPAGLPAGTCTGKVTITATNPATGAAAVGSPLNIDVTLFVSTGAQLVLTPPDPPAFTVGMNAQSAAPPIILSSTGSDVLTYTVAFQSPGSWLSVNTLGGTTTANNSLILSVNTFGLAAGPYSGTVTVTATGPGGAAVANSPVTIPVTLNVTAGSLTLSPSDLTFPDQTLGGPAPASQTVTIGSSGPAPLNFTVAAAMLNGANWLSATPASGTTPSTVQVQVNGAALPVGQYIGSVTIASAGAAGSPIAVGVILNVVPPAVLAASPTTLAFAYIIGQAAPAPQNLAVSGTGSTGNVPLSTQVQYAGAAVQSWLTVTPTSSNAPATFAVSILPGSLAAGTYTGKVVITSPNALVAATVDVTLTVTAIPQPVVTAVANAANYATGAVSPGENIVIFGSGVGPAEITSASPVNNVFPTLVGATRVLFDNTAAPIIYVSAGQTSVMVPYGVAGRTTTTIVVEYSGVQSAALTYNVALAAPGIYTLNKQGTGPGAILNQDGLTVNGLTTPEQRGNVIAIYMTGEGQTNPQGADGVVIPTVVSALKKPQQTVTVTIGGVDAVVAYAGSAPGLISGVMQVNATIPLTAPTGTQPVVVTVSTAKSQSGAGAATVVIQ